ncbi:MAG: hypothetical protein JSS93_05265 [Bacteroidetes bacterium]|nr:hypothetical protein [Bacteroidota bacterium]
MKTRKNELDVDFIGGVGSLTKDEEKRISDFIKAHKTKQKLSAQKMRRKVTTKKRVTA